MSDTKACGDCKHFSQWEEVESWEMPHIRWWEMECQAKPGNANLKSFPFLNTKCAFFEQKVTK